jgi:hypothetical protein
MKQQHYLWIIAVVITAPADSHGKLNFGQNIF